jgi:hypothetical protein
MRLKLKKTDRGFLRGEFTDLYGEECSIQESSLADREAIWLGREHEAIHHAAEQAPGSRMHLDRKMARKLGVMLTRFADAGKLG